LGLPAFAPFDKVLITCAAPSLPKELVKQMKIGGVMVVPIGEGTQTMYRIKKLSETEIDVQSYGEFKFVPMLKERKFY
jgi:protein-L-isoaspartate(D-aspartate) O-methyltransferase